MTPEHDARTRAQNELTLSVDVAMRAPLATVSTYVQTLQDVRAIADIVCQQDITADWVQTYHKLMSLVRANRALFGAYTPDSRRRVVARQRERMETFEKITAGLDIVG